MTKCYEKYFICDKYFYHINYGVIQGFPALRKTVNKTKIRKEKPKVTYSVALVMAFLAAGNENRRLEDLPQADFGRVPE